MEDPEQLKPTPFADGKIDKSRERFHLYRNLVKRNPIMPFALSLLKEGGARDRSGMSIEPASDGSVGIAERDRNGFRNISEHNMNVALTANELARLSGLDSDTKDLVAAGASVHDATKQIEISLNSFPVLMADPNIPPEERARAEEVIQNKLKSLGVDDRISLTELKDSANQSMLAYLKKMDKINRLFFEDHLKDANLTDKQKKGLRELSSADSFGNLDRLIARLQRLILTAQEDAAISEFKTYADSISHKLPKVDDDGLDLPVCLLWASDYLVTGTKLEPSSDARIDALIKKGEYESLDYDWASRMSEGGKTQFETTRTAVKAVESIIRQKAIAGGKIDNGDARTIPAIVLDNLRRSVLS